MPVSQESHIEMAIAAYKSKKIKSKLQAAKVFGVSETTLRAQLDGRKSRSESRASGYILSSIAEDALVKQLLDADRRGLLIRPEFLRGMAQILLREQTHDSTATLGVNRASTFIKRHPELRTQYNWRILYQRAKQENPKIINKWFKVISKAI